MTRKIRVKKTRLMENYNEIFKSENQQKFFDIINNNMLLLLDGNELKVYIELIHLNNIHQKISMRTIMRFTRFSCSQTQQAIKTLRTIGIIGDKGYNLNLEKIEEIYNQLNSIIKLDDKLSYCDSLLNGEEVENINEPEPIKQEEVEQQIQEPIYNKVEQQEQPTIDIETSTTQDITMQEPIKEKEVMNNEEVTTTVQEQPKNTVPSKQELEKNAYILINSDMNLLLEPYTRTVYEELIHLNNIKQKISIRTIMRLTRISSEKVQSCIKTLRTIGIIGDKGYNLNLERIEAIYNQLNSIVKLDDKLAYCDSLLNGTNEAIETIQQEEEEPIYNKVEEEEQEQTTIDMEEQPTIDITIQEPKEEEVINNKNKEVMNNEEEVTTVQEPIQEPKEEEVQEHQQVPSKQELEKNAYILLNKMMQCDSKKEWADKQDKLFNYVAQNNTWSKEELNRITSALIETKTMWEQEQYHKAMSLIEAAQCGI